MEPNNQCRSNNPCTQALSYSIGIKLKLITGTLVLFKNVFNSVNVDINLI